MWLTDAVIAAAAVLIMVVGTRGAAEEQHAFGRRPLDTLAYVLIGLAAVCLLFRRGRSDVALAGAVTVTTAWLAAEYPWGPLLFVIPVTMYGYAVRVPIRRSLTVAALSLGVLVTGELIGAALSDRGGHALREFPITVAVRAVMVLLPWMLGAVIRLYQVDEARAREDELRHRAFQERLRVAREVHDIVGHGLAALHMQASVALHVLERRPEQARAALEAIKHGSKQALEELRATLAVFQSPDELPENTSDSFTRRPAEGLGQLDTLVDRMAASGRTVKVEVTGEPVGLPAAVDAAAFRIVREALTNVLRHAGADAVTTVGLRYAPRSLTVEIVDNGRARPEDPRTDGLGITGMRERAAALGGTLEAGPRPHGGFLVRAYLPLPPSASGPDGTRDHNGAL